jgi:hypothetical protein
MPLLFQGLETTAARISAKAAQKLSPRPIFSNNLKQDLPVTGLLQRAIGTMLKWGIPRRTKTRNKPSQ